MAAGHPALTHNAVNRLPACAGRGKRLRRVLDDDGRGDRKKLIKRRVGLTLGLGRSLMHGVAPQMCGRVASPLLGRGAGGSLPRLPYVAAIGSLCRNDGGKTVPLARQQGASHRSPTRLGNGFLGPLVRTSFSLHERPARGKSRRGTWPARDGLMPAGQIGELRSYLYVCQTAADIDCD
jgi:hypothetical protein